MYQTQNPLQAIPTAFPMNGGFCGDPLSGQNIERDPSRSSNRKVHCFCSRYFPIQFDAPTRVYIDGKSIIYNTYIYIYILKRKQSQSLAALVCTLAALRRGRRPQRKQRRHDPPEAKMASWPGCGQGSKDNSA